MTRSGDPRLGRIRIPPIPKETVLTDRDDGKTYKIVKDNGSPGLSELTGTLNRNRYWVYAAFEGPVIVDDTGAEQRLFVSEGSLDFEATGDIVSQAPVMALVSKRPLEVWQVTIESGALALEQVA